MLTGKHVTMSSNYFNGVKKASSNPYTKAPSVAADIQDQFIFASTHFIFIHPEAGWASLTTGLHLSHRKNPNIRQMYKIILFTVCCLNEADSPINTGQGINIHQGPFVVLLAVASLGELCTWQTSLHCSLENAAKPPCELQQAN